MSGLYLSGWSPQGARKAWDRVSMEETTTERYLSNHPFCTDNGALVEAVGWFDEDNGGDLRLLVADYENGRRVILRLRPNGYHSATATWRTA